VRRRTLISNFVLAALAGYAWAGVSSTAAQTSAGALSDRAKTVLFRALTNEQGLVQVHAADALIAFGETEPVRRVFEAKLPIDGASPYCVGAWRVLAGSARSFEDRAVWIAKIEQVFLDSASGERVGAIESLCKVGHVVTGRTLATARTMATTATEADAIFALWALHLAGDRSAMSRIADALDSTVAVARLRAAYVLRWVGTTDPAVLKKLAKAADGERADMIDYTTLLGAALVLDADPAHVATWQARLERVLETGSADARSDACQSLMRRYTAADLHRIEPLLDHPEAEARIGAARAVLYVLKHA
jgi:hypothetical protein